MNSKGRINEKMELPKVRMNKMTSKFKNTLKLQTPYPCTISEFHFL